MVKGKETISNSKILVIDIETMAALMYGWRMFKENHSVEQVVEPPRVICFGAMWHGEKDVMFYSEWEHGAEGMLQVAYDLINEADAIVGFNHKKFDLPHLNAEFFKRGWISPAKPTTIDLQQIAKTNFRFLSNKLQFISQYAGIGHKIEHEGFPLWLKVAAGNLVAQKKMEKYCKQDVKLTDKLYRRMKSYIYNHPAFHRARHDCGSTHAHSRGYRYTMTMRIQRLQCQKCGGWYDGKKEKLIT